MRRCLLIIALLCACLTACQSTPVVPKTVTVTVPEYRPLPAWITPVPVYQRSGSTVGDHLTAECRHKLDQQVANCRIAAAVKIVNGQAVVQSECALVEQCKDAP